MLVSPLPPFRRVHLRDRPPAVPRQLRGHAVPLPLPGHAYLLLPLLPAQVPPGLLDRHLRPRGHLRPHVLPAGDALLARGEGQARGGEV